MTKKYDIMMGCLGNGITVWNRAEEVHGDYRKIAHINTDREVKFYEKNLPHDVIARIDKAAKEATFYA